MSALGWVSLIIGLLLLLIIIGAVVWWLRTQSGRRSAVFIPRSAIWSRSRALRTGIRSRGY